MKKLLLTSVVLAAASTAGAQSFGSGLGLRGAEVGLTAGYASGLSGEIFVHKPNVVGPFGIKLSAAYTNPKDSIVDSVSVNSTLGLGTFGSYKAKGLASESGSHTVLGLDGTYNLGEVAPGISVLAYAGPRYGFFKGTESYTGTGSTTYSMNSFGIGAGAQVSYAVAGNISLVGDLGVDHFMDGGISASNSNSGTTGTGDAGYNTLRNRLAFPGTTFKAKLGVKFSF